MSKQFKSPIEPSVYQGKQIVINSDRILFNAKNDFILGFSSEGIHFQTDGPMVNVCAGPYVIKNKREIFLGMKGDERPTEPALLGDKTGTYLQDMLNLIQDIILFLAAEYKVTVPLVGVSAPGPNDISSFMQTIAYLKSEGRLSDIKSKKVKLV